MSDKVFFQTSSVLSHYISNESVSVLVSKQKRSLLLGDELRGLHYREVGTMENNAQNPYNNRFDVGNDWLYRRLKGHN